tara:strand:+ start:865 stop:2181 length:1317 start_codon:yes stop_codon:yes gene_type:complete
MSHSHKKSIRVLTDVQMSDGTAVDGTRVDRALGESVDRFNNLEQGDFSEQFTKSSFVFGMQPSPIVPVPKSTVAGSGSNLPGFGDIKCVMTDATSYPISGQWLPWLPIVNQKYSSHATNISGANYPEKFAQEAGYTPPDGFQNKWRMKGTNVVGRNDIQLGPPDILSEEMSQDRRWHTLAWQDAWSGKADVTTYDQETWEPRPERAWQFAWSHSWEFNDPVILDDIMLFVRTDKPWPEDDKYAAGSTSGWYDAPYEYRSNIRDGADFTQFAAKDVMFQVSVDNPFSTEEREYNDIEATFNSRDMGAYKASQQPNTQIQYFDMQPQSPDFNTGTSTGDGLQGRMIRVSGLNIPVRKGARVRFSVILPWYVPNTTSAGYNSQVSMTRGMSPSRWGANTVPATVMSKTMEPTPFGGTSLMGAPWDNCSINGCLTILEPLEE